MKRILVPELLDSLPPDDPGATASRRDLRLVNGIMGNFRWLQRHLAKVHPDRGVIVEIGAGDGVLARKVCTQTPALAPHYHGIDLAPRPDHWPAGATWHQTDLWSDAAVELLSRATVLVANMILHHFHDAALRRLGGLLPQCNTLLACEPSRKERHIWQGRVLFPVLHQVTRHDMVVSIRAGFRGRELMDSLGFDAAHWHSLTSESWLGAYRVAAVLTNKPK
jgi:hypothetical protein